MPSSRRAAPSRPNADEIKALAALRSIEAEFDTLVGEVFYRFFDNRRQVGSYPGLAPSPFSSGVTERDRGISKAVIPKPVQPRPNWPGSRCRRREKRDMPG